MSLKVFIGFDSREEIAYQVCRYSILKHSSNVEIIPLVQSDLKSKGLYYRDIDPLSSTEFTFTRFLVPYLCNFKGKAIFCDCDFLWTEDINDLVSLFNDQTAVQVVKHNYNPVNKIKMDGRTQYRYPRKNWSSMILWNNEHIANRILTPELINSATGQYLHRFSWLNDFEIGEIPEEWNWLVGWSQGNPKAIHYTEGGPWFQEYRNCEYSNQWFQYKKEMESLTFNN